MSRIGRMPVAIPAGVTVTIAEGNKVTVKGPKGTLERELPVELTIEEKDGHVIVSRPNDLKRMKSLHGLTRTLINNMIHYQCWDESYRAFLHPVIGDLSTEKFGLSEELWQELTEKIQVIYHNGALLNFVFPYEFLKETNVHGTVETLRLACAGQPKYYHYVSSYSVYDTPNNKGKRVYENDPLNTAHGFSLAYSETKWVSEKLVGIAQKRGLHTVIYRPGDRCCQRHLGNG